VLASDFSRLGEEIRVAEAAGAEIIHLDIMDGHLVPNLSLGPPVVKAIRNVTDLPFDVHLMLTDPGQYVQSFADAGADHITIHVEANGDLNAIIDDIHGHGCSAGMTLKPGTDAAAVAPYLDRLDMILVMTVEPGFGGQAFREDQLPKIREFRRMIDAGSRPVHLEVDGGIGEDTVGATVDAGGRMLVAGSSVFRHPRGVRYAIDVLLSAQEEQAG
jgi:ribulose-phosphate 3-epimerase